MPQKPGRTSRRRFKNSGDCKMQQGLLFCFCFSSRIGPLEWQCKQQPSCGHLRDHLMKSGTSLSLSLIYIYIERERKRERERERERWAVTADSYLTWCAMCRVNKEGEEKGKNTSGSLEADNRHLQTQLMMSQAQAHHNYTHRPATIHTRSTVVINVCNLFIIETCVSVEASYQSWNFVAFKSKLATVKIGQ